MTNEAPSDQTPVFLPTNAFDFLPDLHALLLRASRDELDQKDVDHESSHIRLKIEKARAMVANLPDMDRTVAEQKREIQELEERIEKQRAMIKGVVEMQVVKDIIRKRGGAE
jgi:RNA polymerase II transcription mediator complex subunit 9